MVLAKNIGFEQYLPPRRVNVCKHGGEKRIAFSEDLMVQDAIRCFGGMIPRAGMFPMTCAVVGHRDTRSAFDPRGGGEGNGA